MRIYLKMKMQEAESWKGRPTILKIEQRKLKAENNLASM